MPARQTGRLKGEARERESGERESVIACAAAMSSGTLLAGRLHFGEVRPPRVRQEVPRVATARTKKKEEEEGALAPLLAAVQPVAAAASSVLFVERKARAHGGSSGLATRPLL